MGTLDIIAIVIIAVVVFGASGFIFTSKKSGKKCIGCPHSQYCNGSCSSGLGHGRK